MKWRKYCRAQCFASSVWKSLHVVTEIKLVFSLRKIRHQALSQRLDECVKKARFVLLWRVILYYTRPRPFTRRSPILMSINNDNTKKKKNGWHDNAMYVRVFSFLFFNRRKNIISITRLKHDSVRKIARSFFFFSLSMI